MMATLNPKRGEVWNVKFDPAVGAEIQKVRPAVVISDPAIKALAREHSEIEASWSVSPGYGR